MTDIREPSRGALTGERASPSHGERRRAAILLSGMQLWNRDAFEALGPRLLLPLANRPLIEYVLDWLQAADITDVVICANEGAAEFQHYLRDGTASGLNLYYYIDRMPRGAAGCARDAARLVPADEYVVLEGSVVSSIDLPRVWELHGARGVAATVVLDPTGAAARDTVPPAGIYLFAREALACVPEQGYQDIKEMLLPRLFAAQLPVAGYLAESPSLRIDSLDAYLAGQAWMIAERQRRDELADYGGAADVFVHPSAVLAPSARLIGPVIIGPGARLDENAIVIGPAAVGANAIIGAGCFVGRCAIWDGAHIACGAHLEDCVATGVDIVAARPARRQAIA